MNDADNSCSAVTENEGGKYHVHLLFQQHPPNDVIKASLSASDVYELKVDKKLGSECTVHSICVAWAILLCCTILFATKRY